MKIIKSMKVTFTTDLNGIHTIEVYPKNFEGGVFYYEFMDGHEGSIHVESIQDVDFTWISTYKQDQINKSPLVALLALEYGKLSEELESSFFKDDRKLFTNVYNNLMEAVKEYISLAPKNPIIRVGFNMKYNQEMSELKKLKASLTSRNMIPNDEERS